jgi:ParB family transcriptional regulator, chromosome partitioning protein
MGGRTKWGARRQGRSAFKMTTPKRGLGRGLGALLGTPLPATTAAAAPRGLINIPVGAISPNPHQPRTKFGAADLAELQASIAELGVLVPIIVRRLEGERYELIAGERRWRATVAAGLATIPALVRMASDRESLEIAIIENLQRSNLDPLEEAMGFADLMETYGFTQDLVAQRLGRSRPAIANALRLLGLSDSIKALIRDGRLSARAGRALLAIPEARREELARRAADEGLTVRALEALAHEPLAKPRNAPAKIDAETAAVIDRLRYRFATHIGFVRRERGGTIEIRFSDEDELLRIVDLLLGDSA